MCSRGLRSLAAFQLHNASGPVLQSQNLSATLSLLLDVVSRFALYSGVGSLSHSKKKYISISRFFLVSAVSSWVCVPDAQDMGGGRAAYVTWSNI